MSGAKRKTVATEIMEKSSPIGPAAYNNHIVKLQTLPKIPAVCKLQEERKTWIDVA